MPATLPTRGEEEEIPRNRCRYCLLAEKTPAESKRHLAAQGAGQLYRRHQCGCAGGEVTREYFGDTEIHDMALIWLLLDS